MKKFVVKSTCKTDERMRLILDASPNMTIMFNSSFAIVDRNPVAQEFLGFNTKEELLAGFKERVRQITPRFQSDGKPSPSLDEHLHITAIEGYSSFETELHWNGKRNLNVILKRIPYENDFVIVAYFSDVTHIREREIELLHAREQNELQLTILKLVVQATKIGLFDMEIVKDDPTNAANIVKWSDEFRQMLGFTSEEDFPNVLGSWSNRLHPEDKDKVIKAFYNHIADKTGDTPYDIEFRLLHKKGTYAYFHASGETIRDRKGNPIRVVGSSKDITETMNILMDTEKQRLEAEAANQAKSAFLSKMSHEIRTPMNAILGITEIQLQNEELDLKVKEAFEKIYTSSDLLLGIINDILDQSKIEAGKMELVISNYKIESLISDVAQLNMMRIGSKPIEFELYVDENTPSHLSGDELRLKQILNNLLSNSFKYTSKGTVMLLVTSQTSIDVNVPTIVFIVSDTGQGMTKEQVSKLFEEYSRFNLETNRTTEGTGLGMNIARNLIDLMGGEILVESEPGKGSVITVRIPQRKVDAGVLGPEMAENLQLFRTSSRAHMKRMQITREPMPYGSVIVVDDVEANIYVARGLMAPYGLKIDSAYSGFDVIERIKNGYVYDVIFMDHMMPRMDGMEATKIIRSMGYDHPIVALTANAVAGQAEIFLKNGFDGYISKPIDLRQLNAVLNKLIRDKQPPEVIKEARRQAGCNKERSGDYTQKRDIDKKLIGVFLRDASKSLAVMDMICQKNGLYDDEEIRSFIIYTHGIKSALANIGQMELSAVALKLEMSGREGNHEVIANETPVFLESLRALVDKLKLQNEVGKDDVIEEDQLYLREKLLAVKAACLEYDEQTTDKIMAELDEKSWSQPTKELLSTIAKYLLHSEFDEILQVLKKLDL